MKYLQLNDIDCYKRSLRRLRLKRALSLSNYVWEIVNTWDWFNKRTLGVQFVTAIDSVSANIAEGFGRRRDHAEFKKYLIYSAGSLEESNCG